MHTVKFFRMCQQNLSVRIGVFSQFTEMGRFYRHVLIEGRTIRIMEQLCLDITEKHCYEVVKFLGILDVKKIGYNQPAGVRYPTENPWG